MGSKIEGRFDLLIGSLAISENSLEGSMTSPQELTYWGSLAILEKFLRFNPNQLANPNLGGWLFNPKHGDEDAKPARESKSRRLAI